jgi:hypothetical protein
MSRATELTEQLHAFGWRPAGGDAERRAAAWAAGQIRLDPRRRAEIETFWCRPNWAGAQAWHVALAVAGSLVAATQAKLGAAMIGVALLAILIDWFTCLSPGRLLTRERASQNVVSTSARTPRVRLIITAGLDTGRLDPDNDRGIPGWLFWICLLAVWALVAALLRVEGTGSTLSTAIQVIPTVGLIFAFGWLLLAGRPANGAPAVGAALGLARLLDAAPPANLGVDLVLTGAASGYGLGLRRYLRRHRLSLTVTNTVVLGISAGEGSHYLVADGPLLPLSFFAELRRLAAATGLLSPRSARGCSAALPARLAHLPALSLDGDPDRVIEAALELVDGIDAYVGGLVPQTSQSPHARLRDRLRRG